MYFVIGSLLSVIVVGSNLILVNNGWTRNTAPLRSPIAIQCCSLMRRPEGVWWLIMVEEGCNIYSRARSFKQQYANVLMLNWIKNSSVVIGDVLTILEAAFCIC